MKEGNKQSPASSEVAHHHGHHEAKLAAVAGHILALKDTGGVHQERMPSAERSFHQPFPSELHPKRHPSQCQVRLGTLLPMGESQGTPQETAAPLGYCRLMGYFHLPYSLFQHSPLLFEEYRESLGTVLFRRTKFFY